MSAPRLFRRPIAAIGNSLADFRFGRIIEDDVLSLRSSSCSQRLELVKSGRLLKRGGLGQTIEDGDVAGALLTSGSHADFAENDQRPEGPFGMVIGGGTIEADEGEYFGVFSCTGES